MRVLCPALFVVTFFILNHCGTEARNLPKYLTRCRKHDPQMTQCLTKAIETLHPLLKKGIPEMHIPPIEPLTIKRVAFDSGANFQAIFENVDIYRLSGFKLIDVRFDFDSVNLELELEFYNVWVFADYKIRGKLLFFELDGTGRANGSIENVGAVAKLPGKTKSVNGNKYMYFDAIDLDLKLDGVLLYLDNVFRNNAELSKHTNKVLADNMDSIISELKPVIQKSIEEISLGLLEKVMDTYSLDELFVDD